MNPTAKIHIAGRRGLVGSALVRKLLPNNINCIYIRPAEALGLEHAVLCAKPVIGDDPFAAPLAEQQVLAYRYDGVRYDCGSKHGYLQATAGLGMRHHEVGAEFAGYLRNRDKQP